VKVSPSQVESFDRCALRWLLEQSGGRRPASVAQGLGTLVHELAQEVPDGEEEELQTLLAERFDRLGLGEGWVADVERRRAGRMVTRLAEYVAITRREGRTLEGTEVTIAAQVGRAEIRGQVDRLERDREGRLVVVDLKTGKTPASKDEVSRHAQLGVYQLAVEQPDDGTGAPEVSGGAALVQLGASAASGVKVQVQPALSADPDPGWAAELVHTVAEAMAGEEFVARSNGMCRFCGVRRVCPLQVEGRQVGR
jgi:RecB family exonuclease